MPKKQRRKVRKKEWIKNLEGSDMKIVNLKRYALIPLRLSILPFPESFC